MSFFRPEARAAVWRWRDALVGLAALGLGAYWFSRPGLLAYISYPTLLLGAALTWSGIVRAWFRMRGGDAGDGPGVVQLVEGRVSYFGPLEGGMVDLADLSALFYDAAGHPGHWVLQAPGQPPLHIPVTAQGAEVLFDGFQSLPGLNTAKLLAAQGSHDGRHAIWQRTSLAAQGERIDMGQ